MAPITMGTVQDTKGNTQEQLWNQCDSELTTNGLDCEALIMVAQSVSTTLGRKDQLRKKMAKVILQAHL